MRKTIEELAALSEADLSAELENASTIQRGLAALSDEDFTDEKIEEFEGINAYISDIKSTMSAKAERVERLAAARQALQLEQPKAEVEPADEPADEAGDEGEVADPAEDATKDETAEVIAASGNKSVVAKAAQAAPAVIIHKEEEPKVNKAVMVAAANVPEVTAGSVFEDLDAVAQAFANRSRSFGGRKASGDRKLGGAKGQLVAGRNGGYIGRVSDQAARLGLARIQLPENEFTTGADKSVQEQMDTIFAAAKESRLPNGSLVAAGGWCAPSENVYTLSGLETVSGILSLPEVTITRGGINFTKGPDYATLAASWGFLQTETQAEAGTEKDCYEVACPDFTDVRLDAIGFCVTAGVLTNVGYPELVRRVLEIGLVAHAHKVNASVISRISSLIGTAINYTEVGGTVADILGAAELQAERIRTQYSLAPGSTIEAVFPVWAKAVLRADLSRRTGVDYLAVSDAQLDSYFRVRNIAPQWVYDYQPLAAGNTSTWTALPATLEFMLYPAGAFVKGTTDVIDLDTIYDSTGLSTNTYTAAFFEEGLLVANTIGGGAKVSVDTTSVQGLTGAASIGAAAAGA